MKVCRECAIIDSHLGSIVDTRVTCRRHDRINVPVCSSLQAIVWLSTEGGARHQVTVLHGAKTGNHICKPPTSGRVLVPRGEGLAPSQEPDRPEPEHSDQVQHTIISQVLRGEKHALTLSLRQPIAAGFLNYTMDNTRSHFVVAMAKLTHGFQA